MKIYNINNKAAQQVLKEVRKLARGINSDASLMLQVYSNGREQGFALSDFMAHKKVAFSEHRSSDDIVVYWGTNTDFDRNTNIPNDETWEERRKHFSYNQHAEAAKFIMNYLYS